MLLCDCHGKRQYISLLTKKSETLHPQFSSVRIRRKHQWRNLIDAAYPEELVSILHANICKGSTRIIKHPVIVKEVDVKEVDVGCLLHDDWKLLESPWENHRLQVSYGSARRQAEKLFPFPTQGTKRDTNLQAVVAMPVPIFLLTCTAAIMCGIASGANL